MSFKRVIVIGCPGSGKSTFSRKLSAVLSLPLYYLDMLWHKEDKSNVTREEFDKALFEILCQDSFIIDGNYSRTLNIRLEKCDKVFMFDLPTNVCLEGVKARIGKKRQDLPWVEEEFDPAFRAYIESFRSEKLPKIYELLEEHRDKLTVFKSRQEADDYIKTLKG